MKDLSMNVTRCAVVVAVVVGVLAVSQAVRAQDLEQLMKASQGNMISTPAETIPRQTPAEGMFAVDIPIDPDTYELGPGDVLGISIPRQTGGFFQVTISPDGSLVVPNMSPISIAGMTISQAQAYLSKEWSQGRAGVHLGLLQMRRVRVSIGGAVKVPGQYIATPLDRSSVLVDLAGGFLENASPRRATLQHLDGQSENVDLLRYQRSGNLDANPRLKAGDYLIVHPQPTIVPTINVGGAVVASGTFPWLEGDHLFDAIELAGGVLWKNQDVVILTRFESTQMYHSDTLSLIQFRANHERGPELLPGDVIQVPHVFTDVERGAVWVEGEVLHPGIYPIVIGRSRLSDVIAMAGGFTNDAWLDGARIWKKWREQDPRQQVGLSLDTLEFPTYRFIDTEVLRLYFWSERRDYLPTDFAMAFQGSGPERERNNVVLFDSLTISVPRRQTLVLVTGQVNHPGYYDYVAGWNYRDYIRQAGGFSKIAYKSRTRIVPFERGVWLKASKSMQVKGGDMIFIPEFEERRNWDRIQSIVSFIVQIATLYIFVQSATR
ncbi:MAG: SLBB domain-containing protein [bacterium]